MAFQANKRNQVLTNGSWPASTGQNPQIPHKLQPSPPGAFRHKIATSVARCMMIAGMATWPAQVHNNSEPT